VRIRVLAAALVAVSVVAAGGARANTLTPCQPRTGTAVDQVVASACQTAAPVVRVVCSLKVSLCDIEAAPLSRVSATASRPTFDCEIEAMCRVLGILCPRCTSVDGTDARTATIPSPCPPRAIIEQSGGRDYLAVRDPTKPCAYIVVPVPISPTAAAGR
jgi:hypothetical protein